jgi:hypothetical protein
VAIFPECRAGSACTRAVRIVVNVCETVGPAGDGRAIKLTFILFAIGGGSGVAAPQTAHCISCPWIGRHITS